MSMIGNVIGITMAALGVFMILIGTLLHYPYIPELFFGLGIILIVIGIVLMRYVNKLFDKRSRSA